MLRFVPAVYTAPPEPVGASKVTRSPMTTYVKLSNSISVTCDGVKIFPPKIILGAIAVSEIVLTQFASTTSIPLLAATTSPLAPKPSTVNCPPFRVDVAPVQK